MTIRSDRPVGPDGWMTNTARMDMRSVGARHAVPLHRVRGPEGAERERGGPTPLVGWGL